MYHAKVNVLDETLPFQTYHINKGIKKKERIQNTKITTTRK
jgi:hypothetical protein